MADNENGGGAPPADPPKTVALENFQAVVAAKTNLEAQVTALKGQVQNLSEKAATVDTLSGQINEWKSKAEKAEGRFATFTEFSGALGTTDTDVIDSFDAKYSALPTENRPARKAWVDSLKAKPDEAPAILRPWLAPADTKAPSKPTPPKVPGTPPTPPNAPASVSADEVKRIREDAVRTGDWSKWKALRTSMGLSK